MAIDFLRGPRWYAALAVTGVVIVTLWWAFTGGPSYVLQIDYAFTGDMVEGAEVVVDDVVVGTLEGPDRRKVVGFALDRGEHTVAVRAEGCTSRPETFTLGPSRLVILFLDMEELYSGCYVFFR